MQAKPVRMKLRSWFHSQDICLAVNTRDGWPWIRLSVDILQCMGLQNPRNPARWAQSLQLTLHSFAVSLKSWKLFLKGMDDQGILGYKGIFQTVNRKARIYSTSSIWELFTSRSRTMLRSKSICKVTDIIIYWYLIGRTQTANRLTGTQL